MVLKGFSCKEWRRALENAKEDEEEEEILHQPLSNLKINEEEERVWHVFTQEVFPRFPPNQLQTLKSVCKNWNRIISNSYFVQLHLNVYNQSRIRVLMPRNPVMMIEYTNYNYNYDTKQEYTNYDNKQIPYPPAFGITTTILGSCDGLLCLNFGGLCRKIAVYNPSTRKYLWVQSPLKDYYKIKCSWFGHRPCSGEYILVLGNFHDEVGVYKFNTRRFKSKLKKIHSTSCCINQQGFFGVYHKRVGTLLHGAVHWPVFEWNRRIRVIFAYHLDDNKYLEISPPVLRVYGFQLGVAEGCLFAILKPTNAHGCEFEMWIMKEYGVQQSWIKYANIQGLYTIGLSSDRVLSTLGFFPNGKFILYPNKLGVIKYTFNDNKALLLMDHDYCKEPILCADSLVSPEIVGT